MPKKRKASECSNIPSGGLPNSFRELGQLPNAELNTLLRQLDLTTKGKRTHKLTVLATHLGIDTTDQKENDPFMQTLRDISCLDGWTEDLRQVPEVRLEFIIDYLQAAHDIEDKSVGDFEVYTENSLRSYKALRSYDLWESGHVSAFKFNPVTRSEDFCAVKCFANPSGDTSGTQYNVIVILRSSGKPLGASCTCVAGLGEACTHIAALMFGIEDLVSRGYKCLSDEACTEKLCRWIVPRGPKVQPKVLKSISVKKNIPGRPTKEKVFRASTFNPLPVERRPVVTDAVTLLHHTLSLTCPQLPWVYSIAPAIIQRHKPARHVHLPLAPKCLSNEVHEFDPCLVPSREIEIKSSSEPMCLIDKARLGCSYYGYTPDEKKEIEKLTRDQSNSAHWFKYRRGIITASNFSRVDSHMKIIRKQGPKKSTDTLKDTLVNGSSFKGNKATEYGHMQEPKAAVKYLDAMRKSHANCKIKKSGLVLSVEHEFIGASPDRIFYCSCHGRRLVEIKAPYTLRDNSRTIESLDFLDGLGKLKSTGNSYFAQIQGQMGVTGIHQSDLVVWDGKALEIIPVQFDANYWASLIKNLSTFHKKYVMPALQKTASHSGERKSLQLTVSEHTKKYRCGKCGNVLSEEVTDDVDASIQCECMCKCGLWFHWKCVHFMPDPELLDEEPAWFCPNCVRNCDIVM